jgi:hypothetical protein
VTPIADMIEQMLADGVAGSAIVLAVRTIEQRDVTLRNALPEWVVPSATPAAIKQRRYRQNLKQKQPTAKANDVAAGGDQSSISEGNALRNAVTERCNTNSFQEERTTEKASEEKKKVEVVTRARGTRITDDWQPTEAEANFARGLGHDPKALRDEFVDFWIAVPGSRGLKLDWGRTYKNRAREIAKRKTNAVRPSEPARSEFRDALSELKSFNRSAASGGGGGGASVRLLRPPGGG